MQTLQITQANAPFLTAFQNVTLKRRLIEFASGFIKLYESLLQKWKCFLKVRLHLGTKRFKVSQSLSSYTAGSLNQEQTNLYFSLYYDILD